MLTKANGRLLTRTEFVSLEMDPVARVVVLTRSAKAFRYVEEIDATVAEISRVLPKASRAGFGILIDMRAAPTRVHPSLNPAFDRFRAETERGFSRAAVPSTSTLGKVRAERLLIHSALPIAVFDSVDDALAFLASD